MADGSDTHTSLATAILAGCFVAFTFMVVPPIGVVLFVGVLIWKAPKVAFLFGRGAASMKASYRAGHLTKEHDILVDGLQRMAESDASAESKTPADEKPKET